MLIFLCFAFHAIPVPALVLVLAEIGLCEGGDGKNLAWVTLLHSHWLAELTPAAAMIFLGNATPAPSACRTLSSLSA